MPKNIVICADGTGNSFAKHVSNVSRLITLLKLNDPDSQCVIYDQGLGTHPNLGRKVRDLAKSYPALAVLPELTKPPMMPMRVVILLGLACGYGLRANVLQLYQALSAQWQSGDKIFLFGFSRGAFTVRALAGLLYRCGLVRSEFAKGGINGPVISKAFELYKPHEKDHEAVERFRKEYGVPEPCTVHFLGLWDTVKSYGGIWPRHLPHLRHNPAITTVRHALALGEQRSWFLPTSWGGIDGDNPERLGLQPHEWHPQNQDVREVWFRGCHCDVGGGDEEEITARIPLQWMLEEANKKKGLKLDGEVYEKFLAGMPSDKEKSETHESLKCGWLLFEYVPRWELDNSTRPPKRFLKVGRTGKRHVEQFSRGGRIDIHSSAACDYPVKEVSVVKTGTNRDT